jgi:hypothetical protein
MTMSLRRKLFSNIFFRNIIAGFGGRSAYNSAPGSFTPYFQYKVEEYQEDYYLYFSREPFATRYINEIFNKLFEYKGYDIIKYLEFHYGAYENKPDSLRFLRYEIYSLRNRVNHKQALKLQSALAWVDEKQQEYKKEQERRLQEEIQSGVREIVTSQPTISPAEMNNQIKEFSQKLSGHLEEIMNTTEQGIQELTSAFITGNIKLNSLNDENKMIQLFILIMELQATGFQKLFNKFSSTDIDSILHLHFEAFKGLKFNTLQKKISWQTEQLHNTNSQKVKNLDAALRDFFY